LSDRTYIRLAVAVTLALAALCSADPAIHYAPVENLEHIDVALINRATKEIEVVAYVLTDWAVIEALPRAARRGILVSIYLDGSQLANQESAVFDAIKRAQGVQVRVKRKEKSFMQLKAYQIDGHLVRSGSANLLASGLKCQDNDLVVIESAEAAANFKRNYEAIRSTGERFFPST
jgi:phosphatidylserine/phosphatidylglycerophosphate/cardiolipin synthase-like enzyme